MEIKILKKDLIDKTKNNLLFLEQLSSLSINQLNQEPQSSSWSILQCLEHLNLYGNFYQSEIDKIKIISKKSNTFFKPAYFGNKFALSMFPEGSPIKKMKTFKSKNPVLKAFDHSVTHEFKRQQLLILKDLEKLEYLNLNKKVKTTLPILKFKLGDTLRFVINHNVRHIAQAERTFSVIG